MSLCSQTRRRSTIGVLILAVVVALLPSLLGAQEAPPKVDLFIGYQWLNPGGTVPSGTPPVATKLPSESAGFGSTFTYNFDKWWGLSADLGTAFRNQASEHTFSAGPRLM